jgi:ADP-heptose:LPS heptosyltransferase
MKILVIRFSSIGDIVFTTPVLRCLKKQLPGAQVHFLTKEKFKAVTVHNPYIDKFFYYNKNLGEIKRELKKEAYDYVIDLHKNPRSFMIRMALGKKTFSYQKLTLKKLVLTKLHINLMPQKHIVSRNLETVLALGVKDDGEGLDYFITPADEINITSVSPEHTKGFIAIVIGGSYYTKKLPVDKLKQLCVLLKQPIILVGGKEDEEDGKQITETALGRIFNACGKFSLNQSADIVRKARVVISHDTGLQYIACAYNRPVLAIWGGTSPKLAVEPYYGSKPHDNFTYKNFIVDGLKCQPCSKFGRRKCPKGHFKCMRLQDMAAIKQAADSLWNGMSS